MNQVSQKPTGAKTHSAVLARVRARLEAADCIRRGVCLLNAGQYEQAIRVFERVVELDAADDSVHAYQASAAISCGKFASAAEEFQKQIQRDSADITARVRHALTLWQDGQDEGAIDALRDGLRENPESAELHFQLGVLLAAMEHFEEAELRFTQAMTIAPEHAEAVVNLALCCLVRGAVSEALVHLRRSQSQQPDDPRIGLLLAQTAKAAREQGLAVHAAAVPPEANANEDSRTLAELQALIEEDPDFVDAFLALPDDRLNIEIYSLLARTLESALGRSPHRAELHFQCGRVLARLGRREDAIHATERAVALDPRFIRALIELGKLYQQTDRTADATARLEQAIKAGAEYADVHYLLGNLYRRQGQIIKAKSAYHRALSINKDYKAAASALETLSPAK